MSRTNNVLVTSELSFGTQLAQGIRDERMEKHDATNQRNDHCQEMVLPLDMCKFMADYGVFFSTGSPFSDVCWQYNRRPKAPENEGSGACPGVPDADLARQSHWFAALWRPIHSHSCLSMRQQHS